PAPGSVANSSSRAEIGRKPVRTGLCSNPEEIVDELTLADDVALVQPPYLSLSDCMHRLVTVDGSTSALDRSEPEACRNPLLNESVVLLDDVVQIRRRSAATAATEF